MGTTNKSAGSGKTGAKARIDIIGAVKSPLAFFVLWLLIVEVLFGARLINAGADDKKFLVNWMGSLFSLSFMVVAVIAVLRPTRSTHGMETGQAQESHRTSSRRRPSGLRKEGKG